LQDTAGVLPRAGLRQALAKLRTAIIQRLLKLRQSLETAQPAERSATETRQKERPRLYLHDPTAGDVRSVVAKELRQAGCVVIDPAPAATNDSIADSYAESLERIKLAKRCDAMTVLRASPDPGFEAEIEDIAFDELERINADRQRPLPCAVVDKTGEDYELDPIVRRKGVARFDATVKHWPAKMLDWLNAHRANAA
jgi:hypothetical protein